MLFISSRACFCPLVLLGSESIWVLPTDQKASIKWTTILMVLRHKTKQRMKNQCVCVCVSCSTPDFRCILSGLHWRSWLFLSLPVPECVCVCVRVCHCFDSWLTISTDGVPLCDSWWWWILNTLCPCHCACVCVCVSKRWYWYFLGEKKRKKKNSMHDKIAGCVLMLTL